MAKKENKEIRIDLNDTLSRKYKVRRTGYEGSTIETSIPREAFEREARRLGLSPEEAIEQVFAVWRYNNFHGLHLSFERKEADDDES